MNCAFPGDKGEREPKINQGIWSMCSRSSIKSFGSSDLQFLHKTGYFTCRNQCCDVQNGYKTILECSFSIWFDFGSICNLKIIPILAGLMIALTSLFHANSNKRNYIQSDHQHIVVSIEGIWVAVSIFVLLVVKQRQSSSWLWRFCSVISLIYFWLAAWYVGIWKNKKLFCSFQAISVKLSITSATSPP